MSFQTQLTQQLENPEHCYIRLSTGELMCHKQSQDDGQDRELPKEQTSFKRGEPVRFTKLAAQRIVKNSIFLGEGTQLVPI